MEKVEFRIDKMDCASEENMIKMKLEGKPGILDLQFDLPRRTLTVVHEGQLPLIQESLESLRFGAVILNRENTREFQKAAPDRRERPALIAAFAINVFLFLGESVAGYLARSMGLMADSLDNLADATVYGLSLAAVGGSLVRKQAAARMSGYFQLLLAALGLVEVVRRYFQGESLPEFRTMIGVACVTMLGNTITLFLLTKSGNREAHVKASMIFTSNDILVNLLVVASAFLVWFTNSRLPDLMVGAIVFLVVANGARRILSLAK